MSQSFTDTFAREWNLSLDPYLVTKVNDEVKFPADKPQNGKPADERGVLLTEWSDENFALAGRLRVDMRMLVAVLWSICDEQAEANGCAATAKSKGREVYREFAAGLGGNTLLNAVEALEVAIINFSRNPAERDALLKLREKAQKATELVEKRRMELVEGVDSVRLADSFINSVSSLQESQESTRSLVELPSAN